MQCGSRQDGSRATDARASSMASASCSSPSISTHNCMAPSHSPKPVCCRYLLLRAAACMWCCCDDIHACPCVTRQWTGFPGLDVRRSSAKLANISVLRQLGLMSGCQYTQAGHIAQEGPPSAAQCVHADVWMHRPTGEGDGKHGSRSDCVCSREPGWPHGCTPHPGPRMVEVLKEEEAHPPAHQAALLLHLLLHSPPCRTSSTSPSAPTTSAP
jgi:hypothetical protein